MNEATDIFRMIAPYMPFALASIGLLILSVGGYLTYLVIQAKKKRKKEQNAQSETTEDKKSKKEPAVKQRRLSASLKRSFRQAMRMLRHEVGGRGYRYRAPWYLMLGESLAGKSTLLSKAGMNMTLGKSGDDEKNPNICEWYFYEQGVVLDIQGSTVLPLEGEKDGGKMWKALLRRLLHHRPERPIDGVILAVPATDFFVSEENNKEVLVKKAEMLYRRLSDLQIYLGLCVPVYVVITKCDMITGFSALAKSLPAAYLEQMFGWSNPYSLETAFNPRWVGEAMEKIDAKIYEAQVEIFSSLGEIDEADDFFMLNSEFAKLLHPVRLFLENLFKQNVYHESPYFRGIYFTGDNVGSHKQFLDKISSVERGESVSLGADELVPVVAAPVAIASSEYVAVDPNPVFLKDLFEKKIFVERNIAHPARRVTRTRNRRVLGTQIAMAAITLIWGLGMVFGYNNLLEKKQILLPFLKALAEYTADGLDSSAKPEKSKKTSSAINRQIIDVFLKYANSDQGSSLTSAAFPPSWFSSLHDDITNAMTGKYDKFVLQVLYTGLKEKTERTLLSTPRISLSSNPFSSPLLDTMGGTQTISVIHPEDTPEFLRLSRYVGDLESLDMHVTMYNELTKAGQGDLRNVGTLIRYLFNEEMDASFGEKNAYYFQQAVIKAEAQVFNSQQYSPDAERKLQAYSEEFFHRVFTESPLLLQVRQTNDLLRKLMNFSPNSLYGDGLVARNLYQSLLNLHSGLQRPEFSWIGADTLNLGNNFNKIRGSAQTISFLNGESAEVLQDKAQRYYETLKGNLEQATSLAFGKSMLAEDNGKFVLSVDAQSLKTSLEQLLSQDFMLADGAGLYWSLGNGHISWNLPQLNETAARIESATAFLAKTIATFPVALQSPLKRVANFQLENDAMLRIQSAQTPYPEFAAGVGGGDDLRMEILAFSEASLILGKLIVQLSAKELNVARDGLSSVAANQATVLLSAVDRLLESQQLYTIDQRRLAAWLGRSPLSNALFSARLEGDVMSYLGVQQQKIRSYGVEFAKPLIAFLISTSASARMTSSSQRAMRKWKGIVQDLELYANKGPNYLSKLESFLAVEMDSVTVDNYYNMLNMPQQTSDPSYFEMRLADIKGKISVRCREIAKNEAIGNYQALERFFNDKLRSRYPFVAYERRNETTMDADPADVYYFFQLYDKFSGTGVRTIRTLLSNATEDNSRKNILEFVEQIEKVRSFLSGFVSSDKTNPVLAFDAFVDFRTNKKYEIGGNQIVDWSLSFGNQRTTIRDIDRKLTWTWGSPVKIAFRWAKDSPFSPVMEESKSNVRVEENTAIFEFTDRWALFRLLQNHAASVSSDDDPDGLGSPSLEFGINTKQNMTGMPSLSTAAKVFLRILLASPGKKSPLTMPVFPEEAPKLKIREKVS